MALIDAINDSGSDPAKLKDAPFDIVSECKAKEAAMVARDIHGSLGYIIDCLGPRLAKQTLIGIASRR